MGNIYDRGQLDWLVEIAGAVAPAAAAAVAAGMLAPVEGWPLPMAVLAGFGGVFALAFAVMRIVPPEAHRLALPDFELPVVPVADLFDDELLLDQPWIENEVEVATDALAELLLDDPLPAPSPDSRVVILFEGKRMPTAGQLKRRIDCHIAEGARPARNGAADAADVLSEALAELRRSMRQA